MKTTGLLVPREEVMAPAHIKWTTNFSSCVPLREAVTTGLCQPFAFALGCRTVSGGGGGWEIEGSSKKVGLGIPMPQVPGAREKSGK